MKNRGIHARQKMADERPSSGAAIADAPSHSWGCATALISVATGITNFPQLKPNPSVG
jgi:hypothetical protein